MFFTLATNSHPWSDRSLQGAPHPKKKKIIMYCSLICLLTLMKNSKF